MAQDRESIAAYAELNFLDLQNNVYPGRGIIAGLSQDGKELVQVYWTMGRSASSRNRVFVKDHDHGRVFTVPLDKSAAIDPLTVYNAMREQSCCIVTNGDHTDTILEHLFDGGSFYSALLSREYEPDKPNFTPRIAALCRPDSRPVIEMAMLSKAGWSKACIREFYTFDELVPGTGLCLTTYSGNGDPLPSYAGKPYLMPLKGNRDQIAESYWRTLNETNKVSIAVKTIPLSGAASNVVIINKYQ